MHFDLPPRDRHASVSTVAMPRDTNALGDIFGGWLMSHADIAGAILAYRRARGRVVTVAVNDFVFLAPVFVGDLVSFYSDLAHVGRTSLRVDVTMFAESDWGSQDRVHRVATASMTYVHVDSQRRPLPVPDPQSPRVAPPAKKV
ncbi:MAG TPA: acyl-CoA thioesterase [Gammaproteobacteria bacterium]|nr:acyl-CoA thioesterase [Gammaproteobacteria bacterium]